MCTALAAIRTGSCTDYTEVVLPTYRVVYKYTDIGGHLLLVCVM